MHNCQKFIISCSLREVGNLQIVDGERINTKTLLHLGRVGNTYMLFTGWEVHMGKTVPEVLSTEEIVTNDMT